MLRRQFRGKTYHFFDFRGGRRLFYHRQVSVREAVDEYPQNGSRCQMREQPPLLQTHLSVSIL